MADNTDRGVENALAVNSPDSADHRRIQGMVQVDSDIDGVGLVQPGLADREVNQFAAVQAVTEELGAVDLIGLEIVIEGIEIGDLVLEINIQEVLVREDNILAHIVQLGEDFMEAVMLPQIIQIKQADTCVAVEAGRKQFSYSDLLGIGGVAADFAAHGKDRYLQIQQLLEITGADHVRIQIEDLMDTALKKPGGKQPVQCAGGPFAGIRNGSIVIAVQLNADIQFQDGTDILGLQIGGGADKGNTLGMVLFNGKHEVDALVYIIIIKGQHDQLIGQGEPLILLLQRLGKELFHGVLFCHSTTSIVVGFVKSIL